MPKKDKIKVTLSSTHVDRHGMQMSKEALESGRDLINGNRKPRVGIEHDTTIPPLGIVNNAKVVQGSDGEHYLIAHKEFFDIVEEIKFQDGLEVIRERFEKKFKFSGIEFEDLNNIEINFDRVNFDSYITAQEVLNEIAKETDTEISTQELSRKSWIPDPEFIINLSSGLALFFFGQKLLPKIGDKLGDEMAKDVVNFYNLMKLLIIKMGKKVIPKKRPITYIITSKAGINIELILISPVPNDVQIMLSEEKLSNVKETVGNFHKKFGLEQIQFLMNDNKEWEFNYCLTEDGATIGTKKSFERRDKMFRELMFKLKEQNDKNKDK